MFSTRFLRYALLFAVLTLLAAQAVATALLVNRAREAQIAAALDSLNKMGRSTEAAINRSFVQVDAMLAGLPAVLAPFQRDGRLEIYQVNRVLRELNNQNFTYRDILLIGQDGLPVATALPVSRRRRLPLPSASSFAEVAARGGSVLIGGPVLNANTGEWTLFFARNIVLPTLGPVMAVAEVPVPVVQSILSSAGESLGLRVTLERDDGTLLASVPHDETRIGQRLIPPAAALPGVSSSEPIRSRFASEWVFAAVRPTLYPALTVAVTLEVDTALGGWYADRSRAFVVSGAIGLMILLVTGALMVGLRQRERVEDERATARRTLENALESMSDGFVMFDPSDRLIACNSRYKDFYKISAPFIVPGALFDDIMREGALRGQYPQARGDIETFVAESKAFHRGNNPPMERLLPDGRWVLITERRTPDGGVVGIRTDITPLKRAMQDLATARDTARAAGEAKSQFLARMSHELRTPLNGILGFSELLLDDTRLQDDQRDKLRTLHNAGKHLLELVNGLLDLSKIESGRMELARRAFPLQEVIQSSAALVAPDIMRKKLEFTLNLDPRLPKSVLGDPTRLRQVILNLLSNAVKFTPSGGSIYFIARQKEQERLRLEVRDTGPGISPENQRLIFKDFVQIASMTQSEALGTGLGLAITSRLVKQMGGEIGCQSNSGAGSTFWIEIPLVMAEMPEKAPEPPRPDPSMPTTQSKLHVLVVDDVKANRDVAGALLASLGHEVAFAGGGAEALEKLPTEQFDLVLLDLQMPLMDGFATARNIRAMPDPLGQVPIFALTASVMPDQIAAAQEAGMDGHIGKPLSREALAIALAGLRKLPADQARRPDIDPEADPLPDLAKLDQRVLALLKSELKGAAAGVVREFIVEMQTIRDQLAAEIAQVVPRAEVIAQYAHRLLGAARTLGAIQLAQQVTEFQKLQLRDSSVLNAWNGEVLRNLITEIDLALEALEAFFQAALVGAEVNP
ncbi:MAG: response regulator [Roseomonas sp.]|nr:response regulator [Roseomonas sp.]MCA3285426.1 response regulator [Roseomonas sp.]MCA3289707.1 response regulator [Roseomonas sp.]MCA3292696.1 response regulator [Roseomonas sp.]